MFIRRAVLLAHAEVDRIPHVVHDGCDVWPHVARIRVGEHRLVAAADVIPDAGWAHQVFVCDDSADRDSVSLMMVRHHRGLAEYVVAGLDLLEGSLIYFPAPNRNAVSHLHTNSL